MHLAGKRAIVTGSSSGIGRSIALLLGELGASVVINARGSGADGTKALDAVVEEIRGKGGRAIAVAAAVDDPDSAAGLVQACVEAFGGIDILVNNAAVFGEESIGPAAGCSVETWQRTIAINLNGPFYTVRAALPHMIAQRWGRIVNAGSFAGTGRMGGSAYSASKSALFGFTRALAADYGPYAITANVYNPEAKTSMGDLVNPAAFQAFLDYWLDRNFRTAAEIAFIKDLCGPEGVAPWVAYLCSEGASYINGQVFAVEGRKVALMSPVEETRGLYRDFAEQGPWSQEELAQLAPLAFPIANPWPPGEEADLARWERV